MNLDDIKNYWDLRADGYAKKNSDELISNESAVWEERLARFISKEKNYNCLDIGCGPGFLGVLLLKMGHSVTFADYSVKMLEKAKLNASRYEGKVEFKRIDAQNTGFPDETFDLIVSRNLVWNLEKPEQAYDDWLRILKPGGKILIFDGNHYLYCYNEKYLEERKCKHYKDPHTKEYMQGVDSTIINDIAVNLPLSAVERPKWDMECFLEKRIKSLKAEPVFNDFYGIDGKKKIIN